MGCPHWWCVMMSSDAFLWAVIVLSVTWEEGSKRV